MSMSFDAFKQNIQTDYQAHVVAWRQAIDKNTELTAEEKALLADRVNPILKEMQVTIGLIFNTIDSGIAVALNNDKGKFIR